MTTATIRADQSLPASIRVLIDGITIVSIMLLIIGSILGGVALVATHGQIGPRPHQFFNPISVLAFGLIGAMIARHHHGHPIGWTFILIGLLSSINLTTLGYVMFNQSSILSTDLPGTAFAQWLDRWIWIIPTTLPLTLVLLWFPDGTLPSPNWRPVLWSVVFGMTGLCLASAFHPSLEGLAADPNPFGIPGSEPFLETVLYGTGAIFILGFVGSITALVVRYRRSRGLVREQMKWLVYACGWLIGSIVIGGMLPLFLADPSMAEEVSIILTSLATVSIVVATGIAIVRHRLYDIDIIINRTLVYTILTIAVVTIYVILVGGLSNLVLQTNVTPALSLIATGLIAILFQPLRDRLQRLVNRLMYGYRDEPYTVLSELSTQLESTLAPDAALPVVVKAIARAFKCPFVELISTGSADRVTVGDRSPIALELPLTYHGKRLGYLRCAARRPDDIFSPSEVQLLEDIAYQAGIVMHMAQLTVDLQQSRQQIVTAREEERRRLRRELHDGFGPTLAALHIQAGTLRRLIKQNPDEAESMMNEFRLEIRQLIDDIRRLAYALRPPALDELGLVGAIKTQAENMSIPSTHAHTAILIESPESLPNLPAAVEVAVYRIVQEALTNVMRHAKATECILRLDLEDQLVVEIEDNGIGIPDNQHAGVGLISMRERAEELGGICTIDSHSGGGTCVRATLPLYQPE